MGIWRTTITHAFEGSLVISEPEGLASAIIGLTRHPEFHSLIKEFKSSFRSYGSNGTQDGGREFLKNIERTYGPDSVVNILCEYSDDDRFTFDTVFEGEVGIQTFVEGLEMDHTIELTPVQKGFWRKAMSRFDTVVDIQSALNLDGNAVDVLTPEVLNLPSQIISYFGEYDFSLTFSFEYTRAQINFDIIIRDDIKKITIPNARYYTETDGGFTTNTAGSFFKAPADGVYIFEIQIFHASHGSDVNLLNWFGSDNWRLMKAGSNFNLDSQTNVELGKTLHLGPGSQSIAQTYGLHEFNLLEGEEVQLLGFFDSFSNATVFSNRRLVYKTDCDLATIGTIALSGEQIIDGVLTSSSRVLVWNQDDKADNGVYISAAGAWSRASDVDSASELINAAFKILSGDTFSGLFFRQTNDNLTTLGTDIVTFEEFPENHEYLSPYPGWAPEPINFLRIEAKTTFEDTEHQAFLTHDVAASICDRITEPGRFYSELFGSPYTQARTYLESGAWWNNVNIKGVHLRGYSLSEKLFSKSLKKWWDNANPMFNLSMGYERIAGVDVIRVEEKAHCYDASSMTVLLSSVQRIKRKYNNSQYFNAVENGYAKGKVEDISGIDDPQKQFRASIFKNIGQKITLFTEWIGQSISIEVTRRTTRTKSADYKLDDDTFIIEVTRDAGGEYSPRLNEDFDAVTGLLNEETRYNKHHTPARFFLRWLNYLSGCLQNYVGTVFRFTGGEGNYDMASEMVDGSAPDDYDGGNLAENADIPVSQDILYIPIEFEIEHYLTMAEFNLIDANRTKAIGVSQTDTDHQAFFITDLQLEVISGQIKLMGYFKEPFDIRNVPQSATIVQGGRIFDATFDSSFE